jgi:hypothetical protein
VKSKTIAACLAVSVASAFGMPTSPFTEALINGESQTPLPDDKNFAALTELIQKKTGDAGQVMIKAVRILKFKTQPNCGRIAFIVTQPSKNIAWTNLGGQLNICNDGQPPLRECKESPGVLYQPGHKCPNGQTAAETEEVAAATAKAIQNGGLTHAQAKAQTYQGKLPKTGSERVEK